MAVDIDPAYKTDWDIPMVKNFYISHHGADDEWQAIFKQLGLIE